MRPQLFEAGHKLNHSKMQVKQYDTSTGMLTLAYEYTRSPPAITTPRANVIIRYCVEPGQCDLRGTVSEYEANEREWRYNQPRPADKRNTSAVEDLQAWSKVCDRIYVCE